MQNKLTKIFLIIFIPLSFSASAQKLVDSPLGRFNLGILAPIGSFRSLAMGGVGTAMRDNNSIYYANPASYSSLDTNSFVFDFGMEYGINTISDGTSKHSSDDMNFDHLTIGFPVTKGMGIALGVTPVSNGYYKIYQTVLNENDPITGEYTSYHLGSGNFSTAFLGTGINLTKHFSAGVNMSLLFGSISRANEVLFKETTTEYHDDITESLHLNGIGFDYGLQYNTTIKKDYFLNAGLSYSAGKHCKSKYEYLSYRFASTTSADTLLYITDDSTKAFIPGTFRIGLSFGKKNKLTAGVDYVFSNWSKAKFYGSDGNIADTRALLFGAEYIPDKYSNYSFIKRIEYRVGAHIEDNYLILNGQQVKEWGASLGFGIPLSRTLSKTTALCKANFFVDFTRRSLSNTTFSHFENYFSLGASLNLYDFWFVKRRYE